MLGAKEQWCRCYAAGASFLHWPSCRPKGSHETQAETMLVGLVPRAMNPGQSACGMCSAALVVRLVIGPIPGISGKPSLSANQLRKNYSCLTCIFSCLQLATKNRPYSATNWRLPRNPAVSRACCSSPDTTDNKCHVVLLATLNRMSMKP